jgi:hypothetical protein
MGIDGQVAELKAHLIIALAGGAVADGIGAFQSGDFHLALGYQGPGNGCAQKVLPLIDGIGAKHGKDEVVDKFFL